MKKILIILFLLCLLLLTVVSIAETKIDTGEINKIPQLTLDETKDGPVLENGKVYPFWGPICMRYTYSVVYKDNKGRAPEYVRIYFNGEIIEMEKENPSDNNHKGISE